MGRKAKPNEDAERTDDVLLCPSIPIGEFTIETIVECLRRQGGDFDDLERAVGAFILSKCYGWRVLYLVHSHRTLNKYAKLLNIDSFKDDCPEIGPYAMRCHGYRWAEQGIDFWKALKGRDPMMGLPGQNRHKIMPRRQRVKVDPGYYVPRKSLNSKS